MVYIVGVLIGLFIFFSIAIVAFARENDRQKKKIKSLKDDIVKKEEELAKKPFEDTKSEFIADLYLLVQKWTTRGKHDYATALSMVIKAFHLPPNSPQAFSAYGKVVQEEMQEIRRREREEAETELEGT